MYSITPAVSGYNAEYNLIASNLSLYDALELTDNLERSQPVDEMISFSYMETSTYNLFFPAEPLGSDITE